MARLTKGLRRAGETAIAAPSKTRKVTAKKATQTLMQAPDDQCFWVNNGPILKNAADLYYALKEMGDEQYDYHTKRDGNDFANWVDSALGETALAHKLARIRTRKGAITILEEFLN
jgi:hypothetical protein